MSNIYRNIKIFGLAKSFFVTGITTFILSSSAQAQKTLPAIKAGDPMPANAFVELAKIMNPTVVNISTTTMPKNRGMRGRDPLMDMLEQFYGMRPMPRNAQPSTSLGTGFIIREDGLIVTNNHVIAGADKIQVQLNDKDKPIEAKLIGSDERTDIALIKISVPYKLPWANLGSSKDLEIGEWVAAFGNPLGQGHTTTKGIISAKGREIDEINKFPLLQTDTPINPGNSGGPLVNLRGQVIGVNAAIAGGAQGIGFAIPIDEVKALLPQLERDGRIKKGYLGIGLDQLTPQAAEYLGLKDQKGVLITHVDPKGGAAKAGVQPYDVITEFNGKKIETVQGLMDAVGDAPIGATSKMKVIREGKPRNLEVAIGERPEQRQVRSEQRERREFKGQEAPEKVGFSMLDMTDEIRREFKISQDQERGPVIVSVETGGKAEGAGIMAGDIVLEVNRKPVKTVKEAIGLFKSGTNTVRLARGGGILIVVF
jgi:serine protease Do